MDVRSTKIAEGIILYTLPDHKFKNCIQSINFTVPLLRETVTGLSMLPKLLCACNSRYFGRSALNKQAESLYGTKMKASASKVGENQVISFSVDSIADCYAGEPLLDKAWDLMQTVICEPKGSTAFEEDIFCRERENKREEIRSAINDKRRFALLRCIEEMCKNEPYGIRGDGTEEELDKLTPASLFAIYEHMLRTAKVDIFVSGAFSEDAAVSKAKELGTILGAREVKSKTTTFQKADSVQFVVDHENVKQGKLCIGYRTDIDSHSEECYKLMVFNAVFGGGTSSKLFNNVREKLSLCYYASTQFDRAKGLMLAQSGIEFSNYKKALDAILTEHEEIKKGNVSPIEFDGAVQGLVNTLRSYQDSPALLQSYYLRGMECGGSVDINYDIEKILSVRPEEIIDTAHHIYIDTVYFLNGKEGISCD